MLCSGQSIIRGKVIDAKTKLPLSKATIKVKAQNIESSSGSDGGFDLQAKKCAQRIHLKYRISVTKPLKRSLTDIIQSNNDFLRRLFHTTTGQ